MINLPEEYEDAAHTILHFLFSSSYETIAHDPNLSTKERISTEYKRGILAYLFASNYNIPALAASSSLRIERFGSHLTMVEKLEPISAVYHLADANDDWLPAYIRREMDKSFSVDKTLIFNHDFRSLLSKSTPYMQLIVGIMVDSLSRSIDAAEEANRKLVQELLLNKDTANPEPSTKADDESYTYVNELGEESLNDHNTVKNDGEEGSQDKEKRFLMCMVCGSKLKKTPLRRRGYCRRTSCINEMSMLFKEDDKTDSQKEDEKSLGYRIEQ